MRRLIAPLAFGLGGTAILIALGLWQLERLEWKLEIIGRIESRLAAAPVPVPADPSEAAHEYLRVREAGALEPGEIHVYTSVRPGEVGYRVIAPMRLADGRRILIDRGFVPIEEKDAARPPGPITVEGALLWPDASDLFSTEPNRAANIWINRDLAAMAEALGTLPVLIVLSGSDAVTAPMALPVSPSIRNAHLEYALTWFGVAAVWAGMTGYLLWRIKRRTL